MSVTTMPRAAEEQEAPAPEKKSKKKLILILVALLGVGGGVYWFMFKPAPEKKEPEPGEVVALESIQINLAGGHYLKIGIALQATADAGHGPPDGSKALDSTIKLFSGKSMQELALPKQREHLKEKLLHELEERYHHEVIDVYFTEFVTQ